MRRDMDLVRAVLLWMEARPELDGVHHLSGFDAKVFGLPDHLDREIRYHLKMLIEEEIVRGQVRGVTPIISGLTWQGHEFLDTIRDGEIWRRTKETAHDAGVASVKTLVEIAKGYARQKLIEHGVPLG